MTKLQRAQVVELLRCAADSRGIGEAREALGLPWLGRVHMLALDAVAAVRSERSWRWICLEAAARVEEGIWP